MTQQVTRAIAAAWADAIKAGAAVDTKLIARAAIEAMREPTDEMLSALLQAMSDPETTTNEIWQAAIDAALENDDDTNYD